MREAETTAATGANDEAIGNPFANVDRRAATFRDPFAVADARTIFHASG